MVKKILFFIFCFGVFGLSTNPLVNIARAVETKTSDEAVVQAIVPSENGPSDAKDSSGGVNDAVAKDSPAAAPQVKEVPPEEDDNPYNAVVRQSRIAISADHSTQPAAVAVEPARRALPPLPPVPPRAAGIEAHKSDLIFKEVMKYYKDPKNADEVQKNAEKFAAFFEVLKNHAYGSQPSNPEAAKFLADFRDYQTKKPSLMEKDVQILKARAFVDEFLAPKNILSNRGQESANEAFDVASGVPSKPKGLTEEEKDDVAVHGHLITKLADSMDDSSDSKISQDHLGHLIDLQKLISISAADIQKKGALEVPEDLKKRLKDLPDFVADLKKNDVLTDEDDAKIHSILSRAGVEPKTEPKNEVAANIEAGVAIAKQLGHVSVVCGEKVQTLPLPGALEKGKYPFDSFSGDSSAASICKFLGMKGAAGQHKRHRNPIVSTHMAPIWAAQLGDDGLPKGVAKYYKYATSVDCVPFTPEELATRAGSPPAPYKNPSSTDTLGEVNLGLGFGEGLVSQEALDRIEPTLDRKYETRIRNTLGEDTLKIKAMRADSEKIVGKLRDTLKEIKKSDMSPEERKEKLASGLKDFTAAVMKARPADPLRETYEMNHANPLVVKQFKDKAERDAMELTFDPTDRSTLRTGGVVRDFAPEIQSKLDSILDEKKSAAVAEETDRGYALVLSEGNDPVRGATHNLHFFPLTSSGVSKSFYRVQHNSIPGKIISAATLLPKKLSPDSKAARVLPRSLSDFTLINKGGALNADNESLSKMLHEMKKRGAELNNLQVDVDGSGSKIMNGQEAIKISEQRV